MELEAQRKKYLFFCLVSHSQFCSDHAIYCPEPLWNMTSLDLIGDSLRSGRGSLTVQPPRGCSRFNLQMTWTPLRHFHGALGGAGKVDDLPRNGSVLEPTGESEMIPIPLWVWPSVESRWRIWVVSGFFLCFPQNFLGSPISLPLLLLPGGKELGLSSCHHCWYILFTRKDKELSFSVISATFTQAYYDNI